MHSAVMIKQILDFNKNAFDNSFNAVVAVQEHAEKMARVFWEKSSFFPEEGKKVVGDWVTAYRNGLDEFRANVDSRFKLVENCLLNAADQMESSVNTVYQQTGPITTINDQITKEAASDRKKAAVSRKPAIKGKIRRKRTDKQN